MANQLRAGVVWANTFNKFDPTSPFGGYKESGYGREGGRHGLAAYLQSEASRIDVRKTYKLYIGGAFPRSESGVLLRGRRTARATFVANAALASRKDARDAVVAARKAFGSAGPGAPPTTARRSSTGSPRCMEDRRPQFVQAVVQSEGLTAAQGREGRRRRRSTGWSGTPAGPTRSPRWSATPTRSPGRSSTSPRPSRPASSPCSRRRSPRCSAWSASSRRSIVTGNTVVVVSSYDRPLPAVTLAEVLATSDVPGGVVNILTGSAATIAPWLASHMDVNAIDLTGVAGDADAGHRPRGRGRRQPQAGTPGAGGRAGLDRSTRASSR